MVDGTFFQAYQRARGGFSNAAWATTGPREQTLAIYRAMREIDEEFVGSTKLVQRPVHEPEFVLQSSHDTLQDNQIPDGTDHERQGQILAR
jgi:hypothetical protein